MLKIAFVTSESVPFASTGGLGEVSGSLPSSIAARGHEVRVFMPLYRQVIEGPFEIQDTGLRLDIPVGISTRRAEIWYLRHEPVDIYFIGRDEYFDRRELYSLPYRDYDDNFERFVFFQKAVVELMDRKNWEIDVVHANDWQGGLISSFLRHGIHGVGRVGRERVVFTIHNLAYQGKFPASDFPKTNLPYSSFTIDGMEFFGQVSCMKAGILLADAITAVSPTYAKQIQTQQDGHGLHGVLASRQDRLTGILNGIDTATWNPATDRRLPANYGPATLHDGKRACREALCRTAGRAIPPSTLLLGLVTRLVEDKGIHLIAEIIEALMERDVLVYLLGSGQQAFHTQCMAWQAKWPRTFHCRLAFDPALSALIYAGADALLMPSQVEPCGLSQMYAMRYGAIPIVHSTGGLVDTVENLSPDGRTGTGFRFDEYNGAALLSTIDRASSLLSDLDLRLAIQRRIMAEDFSWERPARKYEELYAGLVT